MRSGRHRAALWAGIVLPVLMAGCVAPAQQPRDKGVDAGAKGALPPRPVDIEHDRAPARVPYDLATLPDPVPRREPPSRYGNHSPYEVLGRTYTVMERAEGYSETGIASWYGEKFHGRRTSSGEVYDMYRLTAAHRYLPLPTYARVTNLENGRSVIVRVNDRGPFHSDRLIDLSYAGAVRLGFVDQGTARVRIEVVTPVEDDPATTTAGLTTGNGIFLQAGAFTDPAAAQRLRSALAALLESATGAGAHDGIEVRNHARDGLFRVWIGPIAHVADAARIQEIVAAANFARPIVIRE
jgi:rare lipoprotein A